MLVLLLNSSWFAQEPSLSIKLNGQDITRTIEANDNSHGANKRSRLFFELKNDSDQIYALEATIEILPKQYQQTRKNNKASKKWQKLKVTTDFAQNPSLEIPTEEYHRHISRIIVTLESVKYLNDNNDTVEFIGDIYYGVEYSFWNR